MTDAATCAAPSEHERVRLRGVGLKVALLSLGARALLVPGLPGREAGGEPCDLRGAPARVARLPGRHTLPDPTAPYWRLLHEVLLPAASGPMPPTSGTGDVIT